MISDYGEYLDHQAFVADLRATHEAASRASARSWKPWAACSEDARGPGRPGSAGTLEDQVQEHEAGTGWPLRRCSALARSLDWRGPESRPRPSGLTG
ncbi:hypothetical protein ACRAWD_00425 [Caulobacter segnis]